MSDIPFCPNYVVLTDISDTYRSPPRDRIQIKKKISLKRWKIFNDLIHLIENIESVLVSFSLTCFMSYVL